ncbi:MAG TPA: flagellar assembly protein FliX [Alphaproteobacteria bacterium]|nr:flagellar assembly protein FliX [Alphaproteobacteria bacterium]
MKIDKPGSVSSTVGPRRSERASSARPGEFSRLLDQPEGASAVSAGNAIGSVDALLAAQSVEGATEEERRQARARGDDILDRLDELRHGLLTGTLTRGQVVALANLVRSRRSSIMDPKLRELLDEIELRAEVEIAKLSGDGQSSS